MSRTSASGQLNSNKKMLGSTAEGLNPIWLAGPLTRITESRGLSEYLSSALTQAYISVEIIYMFM